MRRYIEASLLFLLTSGLAVAQEVVGYSLLEADELAGEVNSLSLTEVGYQDGYYYDVYLMANMSGVRSDGQEHLPGQTCILTSSYEPMAVCGFTMELRLGYEYYLSSSHAVDIYYRVYDIDPGCGMYCYYWYDYGGYSVTQPPCGRDESGEPAPCGMDVVFRSWVWAYTLATVVQHVQLGDTADWIGVGVSATNYRLEMPVGPGCNYKPEDCDATPTCGAANGFVSRHTTERRPDNTCYNYYLQQFGSLIFSDRPRRCFALQYIPPNYFSGPQDARAPCN